MGQARAVVSLLDPTGLRPTAIVAGVILALFFGVQIVNAFIPVAGAGPGVPGPAGPGPVGPGQPTAAPGPVGPGPGPVTTPLPPGSSLTVGPLRIPLEGGWVPQDVPDSNIVVRLVKGGVRIDVFGVTLQGQADASEAYNFYMSDLRADASSFSATQPNLITIGNGIQAARGTYTGVFGSLQVEGEVTTISTGGGAGFIFDAWGQTGTLRTLLPEAQQMIDNIQVQ